MTKRKKAAIMGSFPAQAGDGPEVMVIFGCQVRKDGPSILLRDRLDTALAYLEDHPDTRVVVSGGKGDDEHQSELTQPWRKLGAQPVTPW